MSTGLTGPVETGEMTELTDFIRSFVPGLNNISGLHDSVIAAEKRADDHMRRIKQAKRGLARTQAWSDETAEKKAAKEFRKAAKAHAERLVEQNLKWYRYDQMLRKVKAWKPPTKKHRKLKKYMIRQLTESIEYDCRMPIAPPVRSTAAEYRNDWIQYHQRVIEVHERYLVEDDQKAQTDLDWVLALQENLEALEAQL